MAKKPSGLGRSLGELLDDNAPEIKAKTPTVVIRGNSDNKKQTASDDIYNKDKKPKNKSVLSNYR